MEKMGMFNNNTELSTNKKVELAVAKYIKDNDLQDSKIEVRLTRVGFEAVPYIALSRELYNNSVISELIEIIKSQGCDDFKFERI